MMLFWCILRCCFVYMMLFWCILRCCFVVYDVVLVYMMLFGVYDIVLVYIKMLFCST